MIEKCLAPPPPPPLLLLLLLLLLPSFQKGPRRLRHNHTGPRYSRPSCRAPSTAASRRRYHRTCNPITPTESVSRLRSIRLLTRPSSRARSTTTRLCCRHLCRPITRTASASRFRRILRTRLTSRTLLINAGDDGESASDRENNWNTSTAGCGKQQLGGQFDRILKTRGFFILFIYIFQGVAPSDIASGVSLAS